MIDATKIKFGDLCLYKSGTYHEIVEYAGIGSEEVFQEMKLLLFKHITGKARSAIRPYFYLAIEDVFPVDEQIIALYGTKEDYEIFKSRSRVSPTVK